MLEYLKIAGKIDEVADKLQGMGLNKEAEALDVISNTLEAMDVEAGWLSKFLGGLGISMAMLGSLTPSQAQNIERGWAKLSPQQVEALKKSDPKSYAALQEGIQKTRVAPGTVKTYDKGPKMTDNEREVEEYSTYSNLSRGPGEIALVKYKKGPGELKGEAPAPGGSYGGSGQKFFQETGDYIPEKK